MTEKDDPSRVAFGGNGHGGPDLPRRTHTGNGANGNGTLAERKLAFLDSTSDAARSSKLGQLILDTLDRGVIALDLDGVVIDANSDAQRILEAGDSMRLRAGRFEFLDPHLDGRLTHLLSALASGACLVRRAAARAEQWAMSARLAGDDTGERRVFGAAGCVGEHLRHAIQTK
jgi:PAS domain-containing protein